MSGLQSLVTNSTSVASLIKLLKHVQSLPSTCLLHDGVQSFASQRRLLAPVSLGDSIDDLRNDIRYELIDQCDRSSCQFGESLLPFCAHPAAAICNLEIIIYFFFNFKILSKL